MENKTMERILYRVLRKTGVPRQQIKLEASFYEDLKFDEVDWALFVYYLEGSFKIHLEDGEINELSQVDDTLKIVSKRVMAECA
jgi:acyl carrier protein